MPLACFGQMDSLEYRLRSHIRTSLRTFYILKIVLLPRNPWQHIAYLKLNQPKIKATKFPQKIVCGNATDTALYISANGNAAETLRKRETRPHFPLTCFRPPEMWRKLEPSDFRKISEIRKRLTSPCELMLTCFIKRHTSSFSFTSQSCRSGKEIISKRYDACELMIFTISSVYISFFRLIPFLINSQFLGYLYYSESGPWPIGKEIQ